MIKSILLFGAAGAVFLISAFVLPQPLNATVSVPAPVSLDTPAAVEPAGMADRFQAEKARAEQAALPAQF
jgi:hypothetical protein